MLVWLGRGPATLSNHIGYQGDGVWLEPLLIPSLDKRIEMLVSGRMQDHPQLNTLNEVVGFLSIQVL